MSLDHTVKASNRDTLDPQHAHVVPVAHADPAATLPGDGSATPTVPLPQAIAACSENHLAATSGDIVRAIAFLLGLPFWAKLKDHPLAAKLRGRRRWELHLLCHEYPKGKYRGIPIDLALDNIREDRELSWLQSGRPGDDITGRAVRRERPPEVPRGRCLISDRPLREAKP